MAAYQIALKNGSVEREWRLLEQRIPEQIKRCRNFLETSPENRLISAGKLKKLKGELSGVLQYDLTDKIRLHYTVDRKEHRVFVEYIGQHP